MENTKKFRVVNHTSGFDIIVTAANMAHAARVAGIKNWKKVDTDCDGYAMSESCHTRICFWG